MKLLKLLLIPALLLGGLTLSAELTPVKLLEGVKPVYPPGLKAKGQEGSAKVQFVVDVTGAVTEVEVLAETHPFFGQAAVEAVKQWKFRPARDEDGPVPQTVAIPLNFALSLEDKLNAALGRELFVDLDALTDKVYDAKEDLGQKYKPLGKNIWRGRYPSELKGSGLEERVRVHFVITPEGYAVNPEIPKIKNEEFYIPALIKVSQYRFDPVMVDGKAVYVKEVFAVNFTEKPPQGKGK
jgi:protein TonB